MLPVARKSKGSGGATWGPNPLGGVGGETEDGTIYIYIHIINTYISKYIYIFVCIYIYTHILLICVYIYIHMYMQTLKS